MNKTACAIRNRPAPTGAAPTGDAAVGGGPSDDPARGGRLRRAKAVALADRLVGPGEPPFVIAEAGVNHNGDPATGLALIRVAAAAGADAVKFQLFHADQLVAAAAPACDYQQRPGQDITSQRDLLTSLELTSEAVRDLKQYADQAGILFLATPFGLAELDLIVDLELPAVKIASPDIVNTPLLEAAARSGLPIILSTGASLSSEIDIAVALLDSRGAGDRLILLHCVSAYPIDQEKARLGVIGTLERRYGVPCGFSDHTTDADIAALAVAAGACVLEKHFTLDRGQAGPDHSFSLEPDQLAEYVAAARCAASILGDGHIGHIPEEAEVRRLARGRITALARIPAGATITADRLCVQRPADGISPSQWHDVIGRTTRLVIPAGCPIAWEMLR